VSVKRESVHRIHPAPNSWFTAAVFVLGMIPDDVPELRTLS